MQIVYQISRKDFEAASWLAQRKGPLPKAIQFYFRIGFTCFWVLGIMGPALVHPTRRGLLGAASFAAFGVSLLLVQLYLTRLTFRRQYRRSAGLHQRITLTIDESGLQFASLLEETRSSWTVYRRFAEDGSSIILFRGNNLDFVTIPKRALTGQQVAELRSHLSAHLPR